MRAASFVSAFFLLIGVCSAQACCDPYAEKGCSDMGVTAWQTPIVVDVFPDGETIFPTTEVAAPNDGQFVALRQSITGNNFFPAQSWWAWRGHIAIQGRFDLDVPSLVPAGAIITGAEAELHLSTGEVRAVHSATKVEGPGFDSLSEHFGNATETIIPFLNATNNTPPPSFFRRFFGGANDLWRYSRLSDPANWPSVQTLLLFYFEFQGPQGRIWLDSFRLRLHYLENPVAVFPFVAGRMVCSSGGSGNFRFVREIRGGMSSSSGFQSGSAYLGARRTMPVFPQTVFRVPQESGFRVGALTRRVGSVNNIFINARMAGESRVIGTIGRGPKRIVGAPAGASGVAGVIQRGRKFGGTIQARGGFIGEGLSRGAFIGGTIASASTASGSIARAKRVGGVVSAGSTVVGGLRANRGVMGSVNAQSVVSGVINRIVRITNAGATPTIAAQSGVTGTLLRVQIFPPQVFTASSQVSGAILNTALNPNPAMTLQAVRKLRAFEPVRRSTRIFKG